MSRNIIKKNFNDKYIYKCHRQNYPNCCWVHKRQDLLKNKKQITINKLPVKPLVKSPVKLYEKIILSDGSNLSSKSISDSNSNSNERMSQLNSIQLMNNVSVSISSTDISETLVVHVLIDKTVISKNIGTKKLSDYDIIKPLGRGGFATVFLCKDKNDNKYALKKIMSKPDRGVPCIMEASIMMTYNHPHISRAVHVESRSDGLYIIQDLAKADLLHWRLNNKPNKMVLKTMYHQIIQAIAFMHEVNLIHGDVKSSNVLLFSLDPVCVKLSDFNLSSIKYWDSNLNVCTATHRPYEVWRGDKWTDKIDIWSLGVTMYELYYGKGLIPYQGKGNKNDIKKKYMNAILEWCIKGHGMGDSNNIKTIPDKFPVKYNPPRIILNNNRMNQCTIMINSMLKINPNDRPTIYEILQDPFFNSFDCKKGTYNKVPTIIHPDVVSNIKSTNEPKKSSEWSNIVFTSKDKNIQNVLTKDIKNKLKTEMKLYTDDNEILELATDICCRYYLQTNNINHTVKLTCTWIAKKLIRKITYDIKVPVSNKKSAFRLKLLEQERKILKTLKYQLHLI